MKKLFMAMLFLIAALMAIVFSVALGTILYILSLMLIPIMFISFSFYCAFK